MAKNIQTAIPMLNIWEIKSDTTKPADKNSHKHGLDYHNLIFGCDFSYINGERTGFSKGFMPIIGYHLNPRLSVGMGVPSIATDIYVSNSKSIYGTGYYSYTNQSIGARCFMRYDIIPYMSVIAELENMKYMFPNYDTSSKDYHLVAKHVPSFFVGTAFNLPIHNRIILSLNIRYNPTYNEKSSGYIYTGNLTGSAALYIYLSKLASKDRISCH
jgi:hypothetical protein